MNFELQNQNGEVVNTAEHKGRKVVFFYPKASTAG